MGRAKKQIQVKEPVTIRYKEGKNGIKSVYLDCYVNGKRWYEFLSKKMPPSCLVSCDLQAEPRIYNAGNPVEEACLGVFSCFRPTCFCQTNYGPKTQT